MAAKSFWDKDRNYGEVLYKRAVGELGEMESAKSLCDVIKPLYKPGMRILDVGCGPGHYLVSLRKRIDRNIRYTGCDATSYYLDLARKAFPDNEFIKADVRSMKFKDNTYDIVMCNNLLYHLPPPPQEAIDELIRVSRKYVIIRTLFGPINCTIQEYDTTSQMDNFNYLNIYNIAMYKKLIGNYNFKIIKDDKYRSFDNTKVLGSYATRVVGGMQIAGQIVKDFRFILISK